MDKPLVSIIIPVKNAESTIRKCLNSILRLDYPSYEIIVIDDGSTDTTPKILSEYKNIKTVTTGGIGPSRARNMAVKEAKGEFIAFTDADCVINVNWLNELLSGFKIFPDAAACGGSQKLPQDAGDFEKNVFIFMKKTGFITDYMRKIDKNDIMEVNHNPSCNAIYRKSVFLKENGFLENLWPGEDVELDYRLRKKKNKLIFNPRAIVYHYRPKNTKEFSKMMFRYGKAQGFLVRKYGIFRAIHLIPILFFMLLCLSPFNRFSVFLFIFLGIIFLAVKLFLNSKSPFFIFRLLISGTLNWNFGFFAGLFRKN